VPVDDAASHRFEEARVRDRVEVFRQIGVNDVGIAPAHKPVRFLDGIDRATARSIAISAVLKVRFEDWLQHNLGGSLYHPIPYRRDAERTFAAARLRDCHPPHWIRPIRLRNEVLTQARQPLHHAHRLNLFEGHAIHARRTRIRAGQCSRLLCSTTGLTLTQRTIFALALCF
jgi:hypothetical protein